MPGTLVLGLGNPLMGDDGTGLAALAALRDAWVFAPAPALVDGGTWGMNLLPEIEQADRLLLLDAVAFGRTPGTPIMLVRDELPRFFSVKLSPHQVDLRDVLALAELRGTLPRDTCVLGIEPAHVDLSTALSDTVAAAVPSLVEAAVRLLERWGHHAEPALVVPCTS